MSCSGSRFSPNMRKAGRRSAVLRYIPTKIIGSRPHVSSKDHIEVGDWCRCRGRLVRVFPTTVVA